MCACVNVSVSEGMCSVHKYRCLWMPQALDPSEDGDIGACGLLDMDAGNSAQILYNSSACS